MPLLFINNKSWLKKMREKVRGGESMHCLYLNNLIDIKPEILSTAMAPSPIVKTQTGVRPQPFTPLQQQQLRQQQLQAAAAFQQQFHQQPPTPHYQPAYPTNNNTTNNSNQFNSTPTTSPMTRNN